MAPGGYHIMLLGLKQPLIQGEQVPLTLTFEHAGPVTVQASIAGPGASAPPAKALSNKSSR
jgi:copper(I)-binding protein